MKKAPAFQFYAQDFLTGVMYLTNEEKGIYITMLAKQWTDGKIPKKRLGFLTGFEWEKLSEELKNKFKDCGEYVVNERLEEERERKERFHEKQSKNGSKGGRPSKNSKKDKANLNPEGSQKKPLEKEDEEEVEKEEDIEIEKEVSKGEKIQFGKIVSIFNSVCKNLPQVQKLTDKRKSAIRGRVEEYSLNEVGNVFQSVSQSQFLNGDNDRGWTADFDWIMNPNNFIKILEGKYNGKSKQAGKSKVQYSDDFKRRLAEKMGA